MQWAWIILKPSPLHGPWENYLLRNQSLVPKRRGTIDLGHFSDQHLCVSDSFWDTYELLYMCVHCLWSWVCPSWTCWHPDESWTSRGHGLHLWGLHSGLHPCPKDQHKDFPGKDSQQSGMLLFQIWKPSREPNNKRFFPKSETKGKKKAPTPLYLQLVLRSPGQKKYLELLRSQLFPEATILPLEYFCRYVSS